MGRQRTHGRVRPCRSRPFRDPFARHHLACSLSFAAQLAELGVTPDKRISLAFIDPRDAGDFLPWAHYMCAALDATPLPDDYLDALLQWLGAACPSTRWEREAVRRAFARLSAAAEDACPRLEERLLTAILSHVAQLAKPPGAGATPTAATETPTAATQTPTAAQQPPTGATQPPAEAWLPPVPGEAKAKAAAGSPQPSTGAETRGVSTEPRAPPSAASVPSVDKSDQPGHHAKTAEPPALAGEEKGTAAPPLPAPPAAVSFGAAGGEAKEAALPQRHAGSAPASKAHLPANLFLPDGRALDSTWVRLAVAERPPGDSYVLRLWGHLREEHRLPLRSVWQVRQLLQATLDLGESPELGQAPRYQYRLTLKRASGGAAVSAAIASMPGPAGGGATPISAVAPATTAPAGTANPPEFSAVSPAATFAAVATRPGSELAAARPGSSGASAGASSTPFAGAAGADAATDSTGSAATPVSSATA
jgi:hypothetical protein